MDTQEVLPIVFCLRYVFIIFAILVFFSFFTEASTEEDM